MFQWVQHVPQCTEPTYQRVLWEHLDVRQCQSNWNQFSWNWTTYDHLTNPFLQCLAFSLPQFLFSKIRLLLSLPTVLVFDHAWLQRKSPVGHLPAVLWHVAFRASLVIWIFYFFPYFLPSTDQPTMILNPGLHILMILRHQISPTQYNVSFRMMWVKLLISHS